jgi:hypothetical protein
MNKLLTVGDWNPISREVVSIRQMRPALREKFDKDCSEESVALRANTMTRVIEDILSKTYAFPHGGINE